MSIQNANTAHSSRINSAILFSSRKKPITNDALSSDISKAIMIKIDNKKNENNIIEKEKIQIFDDDGFKIDENIKVTLLSTWKIKCGIATYTSYLLNSINKCYNKEIANILPIHKNKLFYKIDNDIIHLQHEFGIMPHKIDTKSKMIITFHTVYNDSKETLHNMESKFNIVAYIVHNDNAKKAIKNNTKKDVYVIPHGSVINRYVNKLTKKQIRSKLKFYRYGTNSSDKYAFAFGFQSGNKNFNRIISACKNTGIKLIISGAKHENGFLNNLKLNDRKNMIFLNKFLTDEEIDAYSYACDLLIFDYIPEKHYSCSGAMHRVVGSGNPVICSRISHFSDIIEKDNCLKFSDRPELELKIKEALEKIDEYENKALDYASKTSWEIVAKKHIDVYKRYANIDVESKTIDI